MNHVVSKRLFAFSVLLSASVMVLYLPALNFGFVNWDDNTYVYENFNIIFPTARFIPWAFETFYGGNWHPLTWLSLGLDRFMWGKGPMGFHATNIILHGLNTALVTILSALLIAVAKSARSGEGKESGFSDRGVLIAAAVTGILFGFHPIHVESVAWISERKDVLSAFFFLLSLLAYMRYVRDLHGDHSHGIFDQGRSYRFYFLTLFFFLLSLLSKPMAVTLPVIMLIIDWYPLGRFKQVPRTALLIEKIPLFAMSLASSLVTIASQESSGAVATMSIAPLSHRVLNGANSLVLYIWKMLVPTGLVPYYPYPQDISLMSMKFMVPALLLLGLAASCIMLYKSKKGEYWIVGWSYFIVTLLPVIGIIQVGRQSMADRYAYLPSIGPFLLVGIGVALIAERKAGSDSSSLRSLPVALAIPCALFLMLVPLTVRQIGVWKDSFTLWNYVIEKEPGRADIAYNNRGMIFMSNNRLVEALQDFNTALSIDSGIMTWYSNRAEAYRRLGRIHEAIGDLTTVIRLTPNSILGYLHRGNTYFLAKEYDKAIDDFNEAIAVNPDNAGAYLNRGMTFYAMNKPERAIVDYGNALSLAPDYPAAHYQRGMAYMKMKNNSLAALDFESACTSGYRDACRVRQSLDRK